MNERCRHCGGDRYMHTAIGGVLLCGTEFEAEPPSCYWCDEGVATIERGDRRRKAPVDGERCDLNDSVWHITTEWRVSD